MGIRHVLVDVYTGKLNKGDNNIGFESHPIITGLWEVLSFFIVGYLIYTSV